MAEGETEKEYDTRKTIEGLRGRFRHLTATLRESAGSPLEASLHFCQEFCQVLVENAGRWKTDEDPLPLLEVYTVAILSFAKATSCLSSECENVPLLLEKLALSCVELLLLLPQHVPVALWEEFQSSMKVAHSLSQETGNTQLRVLSVLAQQGGVWSNATLSSILSSGSPQTEQVHEFLELEGPMLLNMRLKHLIKIDSIEKAAVLAKICSEYPGYEGKGNFKQTYLVCICMTKTQEQLMEEITSIDCKDALDMICNLESEGDEKGALSLCTAFLKRQLLQEEVYCAWFPPTKTKPHFISVDCVHKYYTELTLFWSKLLIRLESSADVFLEQSKKMALLCRSVCHILFFIKVIQNEVGEVGLPVCVEMCIQAVKMTTSDHKDSKSTICKTIYCLLPNDLEVKRACQLTEFLLQPTVDSYYSVESLYNEPDQKPEEEGNLPVPNSLRCELLLALKTQWPFDPEFWDWRTLKRNCLALMGEEAAIVSSIDTLNDAEEQEEESVLAKVPEYKDLEDFLLNTTNELNEITDEREKNREAKKLREQGFVSARFRNWRAYMQYCVLCDKEFLGHRIVRHAQKHFKDGMYLCPICADSFESKEVLEPHVASHVKQSCKERLAAMKAARKVSKPVQSAKSPSKNVKVAVQTNISPVKIEPSNGNCTSIDTQVNSTSLVNQGQGTSETHLSQDCFCPVQNCSKAFKFFRNLMAHVRCHKDDAEAIRFLEIQKQKVVCQYCRRQFVNVKHLNDHLQMHCGIKPYICIQLDCKASFNSNSELLMHRKTHPEFQARCMFPNCGQIFNEAYLLYDHEAQHYLTYTSQMVNCGKVFYSQSQCPSHQENHGTPDAVNNPPQSNENLQPPPNIQPIPQGTPKKEDKCSAFVRLERINTEAYMKDVAMASASPSKSPLILKEPIPVRVKHSIESMLNSVENQNLEAKEPEKCYTPLTNPAPATVADAKVPPEVPRQHPTIVVEHAENTPVCPVPCTKNHADGLPRDGIDNEVTHVVQKVPPQILSPSQIKAEMPCSSQGYPSSMPGATGNEENMHCCPYKDCTRAYSTNKSLSRHVKKQHPEIFEDWKLAKKYNKVVKITAKKISNMETASPSQSHRSPNPPIPPLCNKPGMQQMDYPMGCSCSPSPCYPGSVDPVPITPMVNPTLYTAWGSPGNSAGLMNSEVSQDWPSSPMNNCFPDVFNVAEYPSRSYPQWQPDPYQTTTPLPTERDHSLAATHSGTMSHVTSDSTLMSQYVSSSLMLDNGAQIHNGGQQYGLMQPEVSVDSDDVRKTNSNMTGQAGHNNSISTVENLPDGTYHTPYDQNAETSLPPKVTVDNPVKCQTEIPETQGVLKATIVVPKAATPEAETPGFDPIDSSVEALLSPQSVITTDIPCEEDTSTVDCEANPSDDKSSDADAPKGKRNRLSKRTKWPAIIKDGKVICRRCFREFTSTKSLGGHLSKRSQCKPLDEVDLTADLPTSFLDFLNDPHVPDTNGAIFNMTNGEFAQESCSLTTLTSPQMIKTEPQNSMIDSSSSNPLPSASTEQPSQTNSDQKEKAPEPTDASQAVPRSEDHLMEISKAFQRLDLIEAAQEKLKMETMALAQHVIIDSISDSEKSKTPKEKREEKSREKLPKPFKCDKDDCEYSFMTKEALFKHLSKMHDYTNDMIEELKRAPVKFSPYPCQICPKTFTRTTGLRIHYEKVHRLTKPEMLKLKFGARNRRVFRLSKEDSYSSRTATEANTSRTTRSSLPVSGIKQEPFDIAIETQTDHDDNPTMVTTAYDSAEEVIASEITTVTKLPSPHHYLSDGQNCEMSSSSMPDTAQEEPGEAQANLAPELNEKLGEASPSDKPSSSKTSPTKDEPHKREKPQKKLGLKMGDPDNAFSPYRPYRCVHEGCSAAFTIQQNLILHYRAMHQASLPLTRAEGDVEKPCVISGQESDVKDDEVRCQVKDCSRVFMGITKLVQHYLLLHKFTRDKATAMMSSMNVGTFKCDREECSLPFESVDKYIEHIKNFHKEIAISESGTVDTTFKCEYDGCDCVYTTKSNLLRHLIKKHEYVYDPKSSDGRRTKSIGLFGQGGNGKENFESKYKVKKKNIKKKEVKSMDHWSSFGKPALKSHEEACALCTKKSSLQYPCMIIGCDTVERAERSIFKHYTTHGLTERYIEDHRSQFIFCKKYSRSRFKDANKSEGMSTSSSSEVSEAEESETEGTQPNGPNTEDRIAQDYGKLSTDESSESQTSTVAEGNKKGRPRKPAHPTPACSERMQTLRNRLTVSSSRENSNPGTPSAQEEQCDEGLLPDSYKPLEFEDSFLTFLETSESTQAPKRKLSDRASVELPAKRQHTVRQKSAHRGKFTDELSDCANLVDFRNPLNLKSVNNVKIVVDKTFSDGADLLLKQLQDMRPIVIIKRWFCSGS